jgi:hypothetical protein
MLRKQLRAASAPKTLFPPGHFYSPIVDVAELRSQQARAMLLPRIPTCCAKRCATRTGRITAAEASG